MSYHVEVPRFGFKELPDRILVREDGAYGDHKAHGTPIINYWYVLEQYIPPTEREIISAHLEQLEVDNAKLRELVTMLHKCARGMFRDLAPSCVDSSKEGCGMNCTDNGERCCMELLERCMCKLGVEVD